jgi:hypothetical protein
MARALAIIERGYRGAVETQYADTLYCAYLLHCHLGGLDILLRGMAATFAGPAPAAPELRIADRTVSTLSDPRAGLRLLIDSGVGVRVDRRDVEALGLSEADCIAVGIEVADETELIRTWPGYWGVFFL